MRAPAEDEKWKQIEHLFHEVVALRPESRPAFLENACPDEHLRSEIWSLLSVADVADFFLEDPVIRPVHIPALTVGSTLASFEILELVGVGGMGEVYRARDLRLNREVAFKVLPKTLASEGAGIARLRNEARVLAALNHPNIAGIYEFVEQSGCFAVVLEFVEGETLAERLARATPRPQEAWMILRQIADALKAAHSKGVIHRDLKPSNVRITADGQVKLLDFGLAKIHRQVAAHRSGPDLNTESQLTQAGAILGTPAYMSPEQARGQDVDQRTDIWSFACIAYEALAGRRVFSGSNGLDIIAAVLRDKPVLTLPNGVPTGLGDLLQNCLQRDVNERPQKHL